MYLKDWGKRLAEIPSECRKTWPNASHSQTENGVQLQTENKTVLRSERSITAQETHPHLWERDAGVCFSVFLLSVVSKLRAKLQQLPAVVPWPFTVGSEEAP